nr:hypothetical protein [Solimonas soli]
MLLPVAHAEAMYSRSGDPLAYAFCGHGSAEFRRALLAAVPKEVQDAARRATLAKATCSLCSVHGLHAAALPRVAAILHVATRPTAARSTLPAIPLVQQLVLPPLRAPPRTL